MSMLDLIGKMPFWYFLVMVLFSLFYAVRGVMAEMQHYATNKQKEYSLAFKIVYSYIQEILFKIIFTASGFIALLIANYIFSPVKSINEIGAGMALLLIFLIIWGVTGVSGYLTLLIVSGRFPSIK
jgi:hypothetical protein